MASDKLAPCRVGEKLETLRGERGLTRAQLASAADIDLDRLVELEHGDSYPSLEELARLAGVLNARLDFFFKVPLARRPVEIVRAEERWAVDPPTAAARSHDLRYQALTYRLTEREMQPFLVEIPPAHSFDIELSSHPGEEFIFVLSGEVEARIGSQNHTLGRGDSVYFSSHLEHAVRALGAQPARILSCFVGVRQRYEADALERAFHFRDE